MLTLFPPDDPLQSVRIKRFLIAFASYSVWSTIALITFLLGITPVSPHVFSLCCLGIFLCNILIYAAIRSGFNKRFDDPSLTLLQMIVATFWAMLILYYADEARGTVLILYLVVFVFGLFKLNLRQFLYLSVFAVLNYAAVLFLLYKNHPESLNTANEILMLIVLALVLPWFSFIGGYITRLRKKVTLSLSQAKAMELKFRTIFDSASDGIVMLDTRQETFVAANATLCQMLGYTLEEFLALKISDLYPKESQKDILNNHNKINHHALSIARNIPVLKKDQSILYADISVSFISLEGQEYSVNVIRDITERKAMEEKLQFEEQRFRNFVEHSADIIVLVNLDGLVTYINPAIEQALGYKAEERIGRRGFELVHPDDVEFLLQSFTTLATQPDSPPIYGEMHLRHKNGTYRTLEAVGSNIVKDNVVEAIMINYRDITERKLAEEALQRSEQRYLELSILDDLTQVFNSRHFHAELEKEMERSARYGHPLSLLLLDLDYFKTFNDTYGHVEGDHVLSRLGQVIKRCLRDSDSAYRYGGEEFTIILPMTTKEDAVITAQRIQNEFGKEIFTPLPGKEVFVTMSIGISQYTPKEEMKSFVHRVDQLMYRAKQNGRNQICSD